jgi:hypothetical protein
MTDGGQEAFDHARELWRAALRSHVLAPPDAGFSARLAALAAAATQRAEACKAAYQDGFEWPPARGGAKPPYELQPGTGRRGQAELWVRFDEAVAELDRVSEGRSLRAVAHAYADSQISPRSSLKPSSARTARAAYCLPRRVAAGSPRITFGHVH